MNTQNLTSLSARRGVALVIVLSVLLLMSALLVAFMGRVSTERTSQRAAASTFEAKQAFESAVNLVISQIREATKDDSGNIGWASQPGVIRTFDNNNKEVKVYKLYSQEEMQVNGGSYQPGTPAESGFSPGSPDEALDSSYVNINEPAFTPVPGDPDRVQPHYPIVDPYARRDYTSSAQGSEPAKPGRGSIKGFYCTNILHKSNARDKDGNRVLDSPMRVKWLYHMKDGTVSAMNSRGVITGASKENPPVARVAFWTDDESAKINLNTAAENTFWDIPAISSLQDAGGVDGDAQIIKNQPSLYLASSQPARDEFQRYPGHPATTSLSPALRWLFPPTWSEVDYKEALFRLLPRINGGVGTSVSGTENSWRLYFHPTNGTRQNNLDPRVSERDRLFASVDEFWFRPDRSQIMDPGLYGVFRDPANTRAAGNGKPDYAVPNMTRFGITPASVIERMRFFLTAVSRSSDLNLYGKPRIPTWAMADQPTPVASGATDRRSVFDDLIAFCSTIAGRNYYFTRTKSWDPYYDLERAGRTRPKDLNPDGRNKKLFEYLQELTSKDVPGTDANFLGKYGDDRDQILTEIFDYFRCTNLIDTGNKQVSLPFPPTTFTPYPFAYTHGYDNMNEGDTAKYNGGTKSNLGSGQVVPIIRRDGATPVNRGFGRFLTVSESGIAFFIDNSTDIPGFDTHKRTNPTDIPIRAVLLTEMFSVSPGYPAHSEAYCYKVSDAPPNPTDPVLAFIPEDPNKEPVPMQFARGDLNYVEVDCWRGPDGRFFNSTKGFANQFRYDSTPTGSRLNKSFFLNNTIDNRPGPVDAFTYRRYPFFSRKFYVSNLTTPTQQPTQFKFRGGQIRYDIYSLAVPDSGLPPNPPPYHPGQGELLQEVLVNFNVAPTGASVFTVQMPTAFPATGVAGIAQTVDGAVTAIVNTPTNADNNANWSAFAVRSMELNGVAKADARMQMANFKVPSSYYSKTGTPGRFESNTRQVHNFRTGWGRVYPGGPNSGQNTTTATDVAGDLVPGQVHRDKLTDIPQTIQGVPAAGGPPQPYGDFDRGLGKNADGAYVNKPDEGNVRFKADDDPAGGGSVPYFRGANGYDETGTNFFSPNRIIPSAVMLGSLPTGVKAGRPWETLLFAPPLATNHKGAQSIPDHYILDLFSMPVVEPYSVSEPLATAGRINLNTRLAPFGYAKDGSNVSYIQRDTGLHAVLKGLYQLAVPSGVLQSGHSEAPLNNSSTGSLKFRYPVDPFLTIEKSINPKFDAKPGYFRSPTQICELDLLLDNTLGSGIPTVAGGAFDDPGKRLSFWTANGMTGDNNRERLYAHIYPRLTTKSNTYTVHAWAQSIAKNPATPTDEWDKFDENKDRVLGEYRGSSTIERFLDPNDEAVVKANYDAADSTSGGLDPYYRFRIVNHKRFIVQ